MFSDIKFAKNYPRIHAIRAINSAPFMYARDFMVI